MSEQSFHRPGAVDLSGLKQSAQQPSQARTGAGGASGGAAGSAYAVTLTEQNFQEVLESSQTAPVVLCFYSPSQDASSQQLAQDLATVAGEYDGRFLAGLVDIDASPQIAQAMQVPSVPLLVAVVSGRPMPLLQEAVSLEDLRAVMQQVMQQLTSQGITGRHEPRQVEPGEGEEAEEQTSDPRYAAAQEALGAGDIDTAVAEYQKLVDANPADSEAAAGLSMARLLQRTQGVDLNAAREAAAESPDDVEAQILCADLDLLGGHVEDAFTRLIEYVRNHAGDDRDRAREHLVELFAAVGNDDERVQRGRQSLASALF